MSIWNVALTCSCALSRAGCSFVCVSAGWRRALYATGLAITQFVPVPFWVCVVIMGSFTALYSSLGGMKGVIWTDVSQFAIICLAIIAILVRTLSSVPGGITGLWRIADQAGHTRLLNFDGGLAGITTPAVLIGGTFLVLMSYGVDQIVIQRYMTAASIKEVRSGMVLQMWLSPLMTCALSFVGLAMFSYYTSYPERLAPGSVPDKWFPHFITHELPRGVSGLVIAGVLAATMSSISSGMNSVTAATVIDFYRRLSRRGRRLRALDPEADLAPSTPQETRHEVRLSRVLTVFWGLAATGLGLVVGKIGLISLINKTLSGFFGGLLLGFFLLGIILATGELGRCSDRRRRRFHPCLCGLFADFAQFPVVRAGRMYCDCSLRHPGQSSVALASEEKVRGLTLASDVREYRPASTEHRVQHPGPREHAVPILAYLWPCRDPDR